MLENAYVLAKIGADTAENEQHFAESLPIGRRVTGGAGRAVHFQRLPPELEAIDRGDRLLGLRGRLEGQEAEARGP